MSLDIHTNYVPHLPTPYVPDQRLVSVVRDDGKPVYCCAVQLCLYILNRARNRKSTQVPLHYSRDWVKRSVSVIQQNRREGGNRPGTLNA